MQRAFVIIAALLQRVKPCQFVSREDLSLNVLQRKKEDEKCAFIFPVRSLGLIQGENVYFLSQDLQIPAVGLWLETPMEKS